MKRTWLIAFSCASAVLFAAAPMADAIRFDASRLKTGIFTYRDTLNGKQGSLSTCTVSSQGDGQYRFTCDFPAYAQNWSTVATRSMAPLATTLKMRTREGRHYEMTLTYTGRHVSGEAVTSASADGKLPGSNQSVAADIPDDTVDQRVDWATVMAADMQPGQKFHFKVYDAKTAVSRVSCVVSDAGMMHTALGTVHAIRLDYTVYKASGTEVYTVYTSEGLPRAMLREDLPGGLVTTLVGVGS
jgi:hypothetical protein